MTSLQIDNRDRFRAAVLGFAIGDALGYPYRNVQPSTLALKRALADDFAPRPQGGGQFSDDTQLMLATINAIIEARGIDGHTTAQHIALLWEEGTIFNPSPEATRSMDAFRNGTPWMSSGAPLGVRDAGCLSRGVVLGLWGEASPSKLAHHAQVLAVMTNKDPACAAGIAAVARALQLRLASPSLSTRRACEEIAAAAAPCDQALADEIYYLPRVVEWEPRKATAALRCVGVRRGPTGLFLPADLTPVLLVALYAALRYPNDVRQAMGAVLHNVGEVDVAAGLTCALVAVGHGTQALPTRLRAKLLYGAALAQAADDLFDATRASVVAGSVRRAPRRAR